MDFRFILLIYYLSFIDLVIDRDRVRACDDLDQTGVWRSE